MKFWMKVMSLRRVYTVKVVCRRYGMYHRDDQSGVSQRRASWYDKSSASVLAKHSKCSHVLQVSVNYDEKLYILIIIQLNSTLFNSRLHM